MSKKMIAMILALVAVASVFSGCNKQIIDTNHSFDYAYILLPNGECVEGPVQSWLDYDDGDQLQIKIGGTVYLTDTTRAVLIKKG